MKSIFKFFWVFFFFQKQVISTAINCPDATSRAYSSGFSISEQYTGIITTTGYYRVGKNWEAGNSLLKISSTLVGDSPFTTYSFSAKSINDNMIILLCHDFFIQIIDNQGNILGKKIPYQGGTFQASNIVGMTSIDVKNNNFLIGYAIKENNSVLLKIEEYQINLNSYDVTLLHTQNLKKNVDYLNNDSFYITCLYRPTSVFCIYRNEKLELYGIIIEDNWTKIKREEKIIEKSNGGKIVELDTNLIAIAYSTEEKIKTGIITFDVDDKFTFEDKIEYPDIKSPKHIQLSKKDSTSVYLSTVKENAFINVRIQRLIPFTSMYKFEENKKGQNFSLTPFGPDKLGYFDSGNNGIMFYYYEFPDCIDVKKEFFEFQSKNIHITELTKKSPDLVEIADAKIDAGNGHGFGSIIPPVNNDNSYISYYPGTKSPAKITFSIVDKTNSSSRSKTCILEIYLCFFSCQTCSEISTDYLNPKCVTCGGGFFQAEDDSSKCFSVNLGLPIYGYYLDQASNIFRKCYSNCLLCQDKGSLENQNCLSCNEGYVLKGNQCRCPDDSFWYLDGDIEKCINKCEGNYPYTITDKKQCVQTCTGDYGKQYQKECVKDCPEGSIEKDLVCMKIEVTKDFVDIIDNNVKDIIEKKPVGSGSNFTYVIYNTSEEGKNEAEKIKNVSKIDLGECEYKLREYYNIPIGEELIIAKIDIIRYDHPINQIEYSVYRLSGEKLNLDVCQGSNVKITYPIKGNSTINETINKALEASEKGYNIFDSNDKFYTDICTPYSSEYGTDIPLEDRKKDYFQNISLCEDQCQFEGIETGTMNAICNCEIKTNMTEKESGFQINELGSEFKNIIKNSNLKVIRCYNLVFSKKILKNYGHWLMFLIIIAKNALLIWFMIIGTKPIQKVLYNILNSKKKNILEKKDTKETKNDTKDFNTTKETKNIKDVNEKSNRDDMFIIKANRTKRNSLFSIRKPSVESYTSDTNWEGYFKDNDTKASENILLRVRCSKFKNLKVHRDSLPILRMPTDMNIVLPSDTSNTTQKEKTKIYETFTDEELDGMKYEEAVEKDYRTFWQSYYSKLKYKQVLIFTFITSTDFNLRLLKISLFLHSFSLTMAFNAFFYSDSTMSRNYHNRGNIEFLYSLPKTIFSSVFCKIISFLMEFLSLSQSSVEKINKEKEIEKAELYSQQFIRYLRIKTLIFFILVTLLNIFFWYYISAFCAVYVNTQKHLIKDTFLSFFEEMLFPFPISLLATTFLWFGIKKKIKWLFIVGAIINWF